MKIKKETVHSPLLFEQWHLSSNILRAVPFSTARIREGGYGIHDIDFWVERTANKNFYIIVLSLKGRGKITFEDDSIFIMEENMAFISSPRGQGHREETLGPEPWEHIWLSFCADSTIFPSSDFDYRFLPLKEADIFRQLIKAILQEDFLQDVFSSKALELYEQLLLIEIGRVLDTTTTSEMKLSRELFSSLWKKVSTMMSHPWTVEDLCEEMNYSRSQLTRLCKAMYNKSPGQIIREIKMDHAMLLINYSLLSISEIAQKVGYEDTSTFSNAFANYFHISPTNARKNKNDLRMKK